MAAVSQIRYLRRSDVEALADRTLRLTRDQRRSLKEMSATARGRVKSWLDEWERLLKGPIPTVPASMTSRSPYGRDLRQNSPFAGILTDDERAGVLEAWTAYEAGSSSYRHLDATCAAIRGALDQDHLSDVALEAGFDFEVEVDQVTAVENRLHPPIDLVKGADEGPVGLGETGIRVGHGTTTSMCGEGALDHKAKGEKEGNDNGTWSAHGGSITFTFSPFDVATPALVPCVEAGVCRV